MNLIISFIIKNKILVIVIVLASILRLYQLDKIPPAISWDEAAVGYNAWTIANYGRDEYGKSFPLYFRSFGEGKNPVHIYIVSFFVKFLDLTEFSIRFPVALMGIGNVILIYFLAKKITENKSVGLLSAFFMAISPYSIFFSRYNHELQFALFFFMGGLLIFFKSLENKKLLPLSVIFIILSLLSYNAAKVFLPVTIPILCLIFFKEQLKNIKYILISLLIISLFGLVVFNHPEILGLDRYNQTKTTDALYMQTEIYKNTNNLVLAKFLTIAGNYISYYSYNYLFVSGDSNPRLSSQGSGQFYLLDLCLLIPGIFFILVRFSKKKLFLLVWLLVGPLPSSLVSNIQHAARAMFVLGAWQILCAYGLVSLLHFFHKDFIKKMVIISIIAIYLGLLIQFMNYYINIYPKKYAIEWQYGMKQAVSFVKNNPQYNQFVTTDIRFQPYIFFLFYLKTPLPDFISGVMYNNSKSRDINNVSGSGNYFFGGENILDSPADSGIAYIVTPSEYDGLKNRVKFKVKKKIYFPDGSDAFFIVSAD